MEQRVAEAGFVRHQWKTQQREIVISQPGEQRAPEQRQRDGGCEQIPRRPLHFGWRPMETAMSARSLASPGGVNPLSAEKSTATASPLSAAAGTSRVYV